ncbi:MAG: iron donor protein CyaY [Betaproteobacteria bacterium]|nr:iron donor protein CyaY [Betaproteobacteria bacterium]
MSDSDFERQGMAVLASIESQLEALMQTTSVQWDSALEGTVLRLTFDDDSRIVINLQAPLREIWLASRRGGFHFRRDPAGGWLDTRDACRQIATLKRSGCLGCGAGNCHFVQQGIHQKGIARADRADALIACTQGFGCGKQAPLPIGNRPNQIRVDLVAPI